MAQLRTYLRNNYWLIVILIVAAILRFYRLDFHSVWLDELYTLAELNPRQAYREVYGTLMRAEQQPPLYFYLLYSLFRYIDYSSMVLRFVSAAAGVAGVLALYLLGKEVLNRRAGLIAAALLAVNQFHLQYSQEGRPYAVFVLFAVIGFYTLVRFLKRPSWSNALVYGLGAGLMINGHFFGLFALTAQAVILGFFLCVSESGRRKLFFLYSLTAGIIALICFLPSLPLFIQASQIKDTWIQLPSAGIGTELFEGFFGNSGFVVSVIGAFLIYYCIRVFRESDTPLTDQNVLGRPLLLLLVIGLPWIVVVFLISLIRSYVSIPMIVDRYFINVLPAVLLFAAAGIDQMGHRLVRGLSVLLYVIFSLTSILAIKQFYFKPQKSQFREVSMAIIDQDSRRDTVVSSIGFHFTFFLDNKRHSFPIITKPLESYVQGMMQDSASLHPFWYVDGHGKTFDLSEPSKAFLERHFIMDRNVEYIDAWAKHFEPRQLPARPDTARLR